LNDSPKVSPYLGLAVGILAVSTASILVRFAQREAASIVIAAYRLSIAALLLAPIAALGHRKVLGGLSKSQLGLGALSGLFLAVHFATWITSLEYTTVVSSVVLVTTTPLWVALAAPIAIKEPVTRRTTLGLVLAMAGTVLIGVSDACRFDHSLVCPPISTFLGQRAILGDFLALLGAWTAAGYVIIGRRLREKLPLVPYIFIVYGMAAVVLVGIVVFRDAPVTGFTPATYLWLALLAVIPQLIGHSTFNWALGFLPASFVAITLLGEPIGSSLLAFALLGEMPGAGVIAGGVLILVGIGIAASPERGRPQAVKME
jgi:drug/metabolite transporter (DMT)-like permease